MTMKALEKRIEKLSEKIGALTDEMQDRCFNETFFFNSKEHIKMNEQIEEYERELKALETEYNRKDTVMVWAGGLFLVTIAIVSGLMLYMIH